jgi:hypothetical protein
MPRRAFLPQARSVAAARFEERRAEKAANDSVIPGPAAGRPERAIQPFATSPFPDSGFALPRTLEWRPLFRRVAFNSG